VLEPLQLITRSSHHENNTQSVCRIAVLLAWSGTTRAADDHGIFERILAASGSFEETNVALEKNLGESKLKTARQSMISRCLTGSEGQGVCVDLTRLSGSGHGRAGQYRLGADFCGLRLPVWRRQENLYQYGQPGCPCHGFLCRQKDYPQLLAAAKAAAQENRDVASKVPGKAETVQA